jgi:hypothetical protein
MRLGWRARRGGGGGCDPEPVGLVGGWAGGRGEIGPWANLVSPLKSPLHLHPCQRTSTHTPPDPALYHRIPPGHHKVQR